MRLALWWLAACGGDEAPDDTRGTSDAPAACVTTFRYTARGEADAVYVAGTFNDWDFARTPMRLDGDTWVAEVELEPGAWPYKLVEQLTAAAGDESWTCDPAGALFQCDEGYTWDPTCPLGGASCNSMVVVEDCAAPAVTLVSLEADTDTGDVSLVAELSGDVAEAVATLDGETLEGWDGARFSWSGTLTPGRHVLRVTADDADPLHVPLWIATDPPESGLLYYAFVDRFANGDPSLDASEGATAGSGEYLGGDFAGVEGKLDWLAEMGVSAIWLTNPQENAEGAWDGSCDDTFTGYHGYWPDHPAAIEAHFGGEAALRSLVDAAHARGMRVYVDWVGNHVHEDHPYAAEHPEWFNPASLCVDADNWNDIPETCWFASYLPDVRYYDPEPLARMVDDAVALAKAWDVDGFRVDAVKHMPHSVYANLRASVDAELEHGVGDFYLVGETFTGDRDYIARYVNDRELDGQFDFALYYAVLQAFARDEIGLSDGDASLEAAHDASRAAFAGKRMSTFLGNHDVERFVTHANGEIDSPWGDGACGDDGALRTPATPPDTSDPYRRLMLAWTFLLTTEGLPLVYYGDEIGLPGFADPDNRQAMRFEDLSADEEAVLALVRALGQARRAHPALWRGDTAQWWSNEAGFWAYARVAEGDAALVLLNRDASARTVTNGLAFAGLTQGVYQDVSTGETFPSDGDSLTVEVPGTGSRVLVLQ
ncbi:MAG: alpha-amylase family glycosyl hydrolase [Myxococcota bacterium]